MIQRPALEEGWRQAYATHPPMYIQMDTPKMAHTIPITPEPKIDTVRVDEKLEGRLTERSLDDQ